eukprot:GFKZ01011194.1.p1 GENE.GFKZ01011194.1~~GFKZ01011194.1.p1  ORF type:complete len:563 (-),score=51.96 GFKZ01011194.1:196-1764(-)
MPDELLFAAPLPVSAGLLTTSLPLTAKRVRRHPARELCARLRHRPDPRDESRGPTFPERATPDVTSSTTEYHLTPAEQAFHDGSGFPAEETPGVGAGVEEEGGANGTSIDSNFYRVDPERIAVHSEDNLRGFIKTRGSLIPGEEFVFWWVGDIYDLVDGQSSRHMFAFEGFNIGRMVRVDGGWRMLTREVGIYKDPVTGEILDTWENPETRATNKCVHVWNDPVNQQFLLRGPRGAFKVPTTMQGDDIYWHSEIFLKYKSPLTRDEYPEQAQSDTYQSTEMFQFFSKKADMLSDKPSADCLISWVRVGQWLPWMEMGDRPGRLVYHCRGRKLKNGYSDLSEQVRNFVAREHPEYSSAPTNYTTPNETSWTYMKKLLDAKGSPRADGTIARQEPRAPAAIPAAVVATAADGNGELRLNAEQLGRFDGSDARKPIYLSLAGKVFDVSSAKRHYRRGETYNCLTGRDATYAFVSGDLTESGLQKAHHTDLMNLTKDQEADLDKWVAFFAKSYPQVGVLVDYPGRL